MKENESRFMTWLRLAGVTVLLSAFFLTLFGIANLRVVNEVEIFV